jgi:2',3'-cyclic-nucleotide 2'-phosphodiesterase (5'-nucleotidase family)
MTRAIRNLATAASAAAIVAVSGAAAQAAAPAAPAAPAQPTTQTVKITVLGVGDVYDFQTGSFSRMNAVARAEKAANPNTIYVFDGDLLSPAVMSGLDKGANTIDFTNLVPFDLAVPGNHEFDFGPDNFVERIRQSKYPWGAINVTNNGQPVPGLVGTVNKTVGGVKVALVPVAIDTTPVTSSPGTWQFGNTVNAAINGCRQARMGGAELVIAVVQAPREYDLRIVASHACDVIVSGDDHDYLTGYDGLTAYVDTSTEARHLAPIDLNVTITTAPNGTRTIAWRPSFRFIDTATVTLDPETERLAATFKTKLDESLNVAVGTTVGPLDSRRNVVRTQESAMGNLITDAMRDATGADVAITNGGGIRADKQYTAGQMLTRKDIFSELPFGNVTVMTRLTGQNIVDALENGLSQVEQAGGRFPQVSGMKVVADLKQPAGKRVVSVEIGGRPLNPTATYRVATNDFMLTGGDGYVPLSLGEVLVNAREGNIMATDVMNYIAKLGRVDVKVEGRVTLR